MKTINDFIKELQQISEDKRDLPLVIVLPNKEESYPEIKIGFCKEKFKEGKTVVDRMIITW